MKVYTQLLKRPIFQTFLIVVFSVIFGILLTLLSFYVARLGYICSSFNDVQCSSGYYFIRFGSVMLSDFGFVTRLIAELSAIFFVIQLVDRLIRLAKKNK